MENSTNSSAVTDCPREEHEALWIASMLFVTVISSLVTMVLRKLHARASARETSRAPLTPSPQEEGQIGINRTI